MMNKKAALMLDIELVKRREMLKTPDIKIKPKDFIQSWTKNLWTTAKNGVVPDTTNNVPPIQKTICRECKGTLLYL